MDKRRIFQRVAGRLLTEAEDPQEFDGFVKGLERALAPARVLRGMSIFDDIHTLAGEIHVDLTHRTKYRFVPNIKEILDRVIEHGSLSYDLGANDRLTRVLVQTYKFIKEYLNLDPLGYPPLVAGVVEKFMKELGGKDDAPPESPPGDEDPKYGRYLFAPKRTSQVPHEPNTKVEDDVYRGLDDHVLGNEPMDPDVALELMQDLEAGAYSNILHEPDEEIVYRGMSMDRKDLARFLGVDEEDLEEAGELRVSRTVGAREGTKQGSSSWTTDPAAGRKFTMTTPSKQWSVVLFARRSENPDTFLEGPGGFYKVPELSVMRDEEESIALGPVRIYKVAWEKVGARKTYTGDISEITSRVFMRLLREAPDLGSVQFSSKRSDGARTNEPDTEEEEALERQITRWIDYEGDLKGPGGAEDMMALLGDPRYGKFFKAPPSEADVLRGVAMSAGDLARELEISVSELEEEGEVDGDFMVPLSRGRAGASWTLEEAQAEVFAKVHARTSGGRKNYCVVWTADPADNPGTLLDLGSILRRTQGDSHWKAYRDEHEVIALAPVVAKSVRWWAWKGKGNRG